MEIADQLFAKSKAAKGKPNELNFKKMFLNYCQKKLQSKENDILMMAPTGEDDEVLMEKKERIRGSVKLIAELFVRGAIPDDYVKLCLDKLFNKVTDDNIESACLLLQGTGKKLYEYFAFEAKQTTLQKKPKLKVKVFNKELFSSYLKKLIELEEGDTLASKTKFTIKDLIQERDKDWSNAFNLFAATEEGKKETIIYRKKIKEPEEKKDIKEEGPEIEIGQKVLETVFGKDLERYLKSELEEKIRVRYL
jgi:hypothetical protein